MEREILEKLGEEILREIERRNISYTLFADLCGISRKIMADIVNRNKEDVKLSTIIKICENSAIEISNIFSVEKREPRETFLVMDGEKYLVELHKVGNTPPKRNSHY